MLEKLKSDAVLALSMSAYFCMFFGALCLPWILSYVAISVAVFAGVDVGNFDDTLKGMSTVLSVVWIIPWVIYALVSVDSD